MDFKVNANERVKVKLTELGISILKGKHDELDDYLRSRGGVGLGDFELNLDEDGYYTTQLWALMSDFGDVMNLGFEPPFNLDIIIKNGEPVSPPPSTLKPTQGA